MAVQIKLDIEVGGLAHVNRYLYCDTLKEAPYKTIEVDYYLDSIREQIAAQAKEQLEEQFEDFELNEGSDILVGIPMRMSLVG